MWEPLYDTLNETKAYNYLKRIGCADVRFIPTSKAKGQKTPDLSAVSEGRNVLCDVKTINASDGEINRRWTGGVRRGTDRLDDGFFKKLRSDLVRAREQMLAYDSEGSARKIAYVVVNFDDLLHEYADRYQSQIDRFILGNQVTELEVVFDIKPAFHPAVAEPLPARHKDTGELQR